MMCKIKTLAGAGVLAIASLTMASTAFASPTTDRLGQCLVNKTTEQDRIGLIQWMFGAFSAHPQLKTMANISAKQLDDNDKRVAQLLTRLLEKDCKSEFEAAVKSDGQMQATQLSFTYLGQVAAMDLMQDAEVLKRTESFVKYLN